jgi:hypothetical protein
MSTGEGRWSLLEKIVALVVPIIAATGVVVGLIRGCPPPSPPPPPFAKIVSPQKNDPADENTKASGIARNIPKDHHLWLAVHPIVQALDGYWPQGGEIVSRPASDDWDAVARVADPKGTVVDVMIVVANETAHAWFKKYLETQRLQNRSPPEPLPSGATPLDSVRVIAAGPKNVRTLVPGDTLSFIGALGSGGRSCAKEGEPPIARLSATSRDLPFAGCCWEYREPIPISRGERIGFALQTDAAEKDVEVKVEAGKHGSPSDTGWLYKGPVAGTVTMTELLKEDGTSGLPLNRDLLVSRLCFAVRGAGPQPANIRLTRAEIVGHQDP